MVNPVLDPHCGFMFYVPNEETLHSAKIKIKINEEKLLSK